MQQGGPVRLHVASLSGYEHVTSLSFSLFLPILLGTMTKSMAFAAARRLSSVAARTSAPSRTAGGVTRTQASTVSSQRTAMTTTTTTTRITAAARRTASTCASTSGANSNSSFRTATSHANLRKIRTAVGSEVSSLRYVGYMLDGGAEPNLLRGWDDGIVDAEGDDGT